MFFLIPVIAVATKIATDVATVILTMTMPITTSGRIPIISTEISAAVPPTAAGVVVTSIGITNAMSKVNLVNINNDSNSTCL